MTYSLRGFLERVRREAPGEILDVHRPVSPRFETAAILQRLEEAYRSPILFFHRVEGCELPLVSNVCGGVRRMALALGCRREEIGARYAAGCEAPLPAQQVAAGPVHETVQRGAAVDLGVLPELRYHEGDADAPYITGAIVAARDPVTAKGNLSFHRLMGTGPRTLAIYIEPGSHLDAILRRHEERGRAMALAAFLGHHPLWALGALFSGPEEVDELEVIGGLQGEPLQVVAGVSVPDLVYPAAAEIVLEGRVPPGRRVPEGPFGEFTGYATGPGGAPELEVTALCRRRDSLFQDVVSGSREHRTLPLPALEHEALRIARRESAGVRSARLVAPMTICVRLAKRDDGEPRRIVEALLRSGIYTKTVIVVDEDVAPSRPRELLEALAFRVRPDRDLLVIDELQGTPLDPSAPRPDGRMAKLGIDATWTPPSGGRPARNRVPQAILDRIDVRELLGR